MFDEFLIYILVLLEIIQKINGEISKVSLIYISKVSLRYLICVLKVIDM